MNKIESDVWELQKDQTLIGTLDVYYKGEYWLTAHFTPTDKFEPYRVIFGEGHFYDRNISNDSWSFEQWREQISNFRMHLKRSSDHTISNKFILHVKGNRADFRVFLEEPDQN